MTIQFPSFPKLPTLLGATFMGILLGGCNRAPSTSTTHTTAAKDAPALTDPCKLLTQAEASDLLGEKMGPGKLEHLSGGPRCGFSATSSRDYVYIDVVSASGFDFYTLTGKPVSGIGDRAVWGHDPFSYQLDIEKNGNAVTVGLPPRMKTLTPAIKNAGKLVASRMP